MCTRNAYCTWFPWTTNVLLALSTEALLTTSTPAKNLLFGSLRPCNINPFTAVFLHATSSLQVASYPPNPFQRGSETAERLLMDVDPTSWRAGLRKTGSSSSVNETTSFNNTAENLPRSASSSWLQSSTDVSSFADLLGFRGTDFFGEVTNAGVSVFLHRCKPLPMIR